MIENSKNMYFEAARCYVKWFKIRPTYVWKLQKRPVFEANRAFFHWSGMIIVIIASKVHHKLSLKTIWINIWSSEASQKQKLVAKMGKN